MAPSLVRGDGGDGGVLHLWHFSVAPYPIFRNEVNFRDLDGSTVWAARS